MGVKTAGIPARDYGNNRPTIAVKLYEGNLVYNANGIGEDGRTKDMWTVSAPITKECYVHSIGGILQQHQCTQSNIIIHYIDCFLRLPIYF